MLSADNHVVLSDFGISRLFSDRLRNDIKAVNTMVSEACTGAPLVMGTQGYMAPEVARGEIATPAADVYSLGVMFVYLLTGIWYEPGSKVFKLIETLEYRWIDVLPRLLSENPAERPTNLTEVWQRLHKSGEATSSSLQNEAEDIHQKRRGRPFSAGIFALAGAVILVIGYYFFFLRSASTAVDDFGDAFSVRGIYEAPEK